MELIRCAVREWPGGNLGSGLQALWVLLPSQTLSLTWLWTPLSFAEGWLWNLSVKFGGQGRKSHISWLRWEAKGREKLVAPVQGPSFLEEKTSMLTKFCSNIGSHLAIDVPAHLVSGTGLAL